LRETFLLLLIYAAEGSIDSVTRLHKLVFPIQEEFKLNVFKFKPPPGPMAKRPQRCARKSGSKDPHKKQEKHNPDKKETATKKPTVLTKESKEPAEKI